jgi:hypothetical protein
VFINRYIAHSPGKIKFLLNIPTKKPAQVYSVTLGKAMFFSATEIEQVFINIILVIAAFTALICGLQNKLG